jgi:flagellar basal body-associated protein FliL
MTLLLLVVVVVVVVLVVVVVVVVVMVVVGSSSNSRTASTNVCLYPTSLEPEGCTLQKIESFYIQAVPQILHLRGDRVLATVCM